MTEGIWIALIGVVGLFITAFFTFKSLKATLKNTMDLALLQLKKEQEASEKRITEKQEVTHKLVNSRMTELLEETRKSSTAEGKAEGTETERNRPK